MISLAVFSSGSLSERIFDASLIRKPSTSTLTVSVAFGARRSRLSRRRRPLSCASARATFKASADAASTSATESLAAALTNDRAPADERVSADERAAADDFKPADECVLTDDADERVLTDDFVLANEFIATSLTGSASARRRRTSNRQPSVSSSEPLSA